MSYVDEEYYNSFSGLITEKLKIKLEKAEDQVNAVTYNRIVGIGFDNLTEFQKDKVKKAVCMQADFIEEYGEYLNMPLSSYSIGSTSIRLNTNSVKIINGVTVSTEVFNYLSQTGLCCRRF